MGQNITVILRGAVNVKPMVVGLYQRGDRARISCERARNARSARARRKIRAEIARARNLRASKGNCGFRARNILRVRASKISCVSRAQRALAQCGRGTRVITPLMIILVPLESPE